MAVDPLYSLDDIFEYLSKVNVLLLLPELHAAEEAAHESRGTEPFVHLLCKVLIFSLHLLALFNLGEIAVGSSSLNKSSLSLFSQ